MFTFHNGRTWLFLLSLVIFQGCGGGGGGGSTTGAGSNSNQTPPTDTDGDGVADNIDAFPNDPEEDTDTDGDGIGDNGDAFPNDATNGDGDNIVLNEQIFNIVLGRPTNDSIAISIMNRVNGNVGSLPGDSAYVEYGTQTGIYAFDNENSPVISSSDEPIVINLSGLTANTKYFYRVNYKVADSNQYSAGDEHSFYTQRATDTTFSFGVQGDSHPERFNSKMFNAELYDLTMAQIQAKQPDLYFMLGDDFSAENPIAGYKADYVSEYRVGVLGDDPNLASRCNNSNNPNCIEYEFLQSEEGNQAPDAFAHYNGAPTKFDQEVFVDGDAFGNGATGYNTYRHQREYFLGKIANATSLFLVNGNHEQAHRAHLGTLFHNAAVWSAQGRLKYYPLPEPTTNQQPDQNNFYSGDILEFDESNFGSEPLGFNGFVEDLSDYGDLLRDYYAFEWGDALFVTIDPYWHSPVSPDTGLFLSDTAEGARNDEVTMGDEQYAWLQSTLENSTAKWKFVFAHHINGGDGRGAAVLVDNDEWGGDFRNGDLASNRPNWNKPIHQLFVDTDVTVFFQGHDHIYSREVVDGVIYQEVPNPADNSYFAYNCGAYAPSNIGVLPPSGGNLNNYGDYSQDSAVVLPNTGFLHVTVSGSDSVDVDYIRSYRESDFQLTNVDQFRVGATHGETAFSYRIESDKSLTDSEILGENLVGQASVHPLCDSAPPAAWQWDNNNNVAPYE